MFKICLPKHKGLAPFNGERYGCLFILGVAVTDNEYLAKRLGAKKGFKVEKITAAEAKKQGLIRQPVEKEKDEEKAEE